MKSHVSAFLTVLFLGFALPLGAEAPVAAEVSAPPEASAAEHAPRTPPAALSVPAPVASRDFLKNIGGDQKALWTSPFRMSREDAKLWVVFGGATGGLLAIDSWSVKQLPNTDRQVKIAKGISHLGDISTLGPLSGGLWALGAYRGDARMKETGQLATEALANAILMNTALKMVFRRERPTEGNGGGIFWSSKGHPFNDGASFPSGHAMTTWAVAAVIAHQYSDKKYIPVLAYGGASAVSVSRFFAQKHFPADILAGSAMGFFIGRYVYRKRSSAAQEAAMEAVKRALESPALAN